MSKSFQEHRDIAFAIEEKNSDKENKLKPNSCGKYFRASEFQKSEKITK